MSWVDFSLASGIVLGALYLLYRSIWKNKGSCGGCSSGTCPVKQLKE